MLPGLGLCDCRVMSAQAPRSARDEMFSDHILSRGSHQSLRDWSPGTTCHWDCWKSWQVSEDSVLHQPASWTPGSRVTIGKVSAVLDHSCVNSTMSDQGHQWPSEAFSDTPLHTSIHYHQLSPMMPHNASWIYSTVSDIICNMFSSLFEVSPFHGQCSLSPIW